MTEKSWGELLEEHAPDLDVLNRADLDFLTRDGALTSREKLLLAAALDAVANRPVGVKSYGERAVRAGATKDQLLDVLRLLRMFAGRPALVTGCEALRQFAG